MKKIYFTAVLCVLLLTHARAQTNSAASDNWGTAGTWLPATVPGAGTNTIIGASHAITVNQNLTHSSNTWTFNGTAIDAAGGSAYTLTLSNSSATNVNNTFTMEGSATIKDDAVLNISGASGTTMTVGVSTFKDDATINVAAGCTLIVNGNVTIKDDVLMTLDGVLIVNGNATIKDDVVIDGASSGALSATGSINISGSASVFGAGSGCGSPPCLLIPPGSPLPVKLTSFTAAKENASVKLKWITSSEVNNDFFMVERSRNGLNFEAIGKVKGAGNSSAKKEYSLVDENPPEGISYYRLKQTDYDGKNETFRMISVFYQKVPGAGCVFKVFPNPCVTGGCNVALTDCPENETAEIAVDIIDMAGNRVYSTVPVRDDKGSFNFQIDPENNLKPGIYVVRGTGYKEKYAEKLIVK